MPNCDLSVNGRKGRVRATSGSEVGESRHLLLGTLLGMGFLYSCEQQKHSKDKLCAD